uniref:Neuronal cell adhesion molecule-like n=1 Tax=Callorhinchus milii TaxID=7868 RepID=A0A4W3GNS1_CALMI
MMMMTMMKIRVMSWLFCVSDIPNPPFDLELSDHEERRVRLTWTPGNDNNSPILHFVIEFEATILQPDRWHRLERVSGEQTTAELPLSPYITYRFRVLAVNAQGASLASLPSETFTTQPAGQGLSHSLSLSHTHCLSHSLALTRSIFLSHSLYLTRSRSYALSHALSLKLSLSHTLYLSNLSHSLYLSLALSLSQTLSHSLYLTLSLSLSHTCYLTFSLTLSL